MKYIIILLLLGGCISGPRIEVTQWQWMKCCGLCLQCKKVRAAGKTLLGKARTCLCTNGSLHQYELIYNDGREDKIFE